MVFQIYRVCHLLITGVIIISFSTFMASGGFEENFTNNSYPYPNWLFAIPVWVLGAVLSFIKKTVIIGLIISVLPILFFIVLYFFT